MQKLSEAHDLPADLPDDALDDAPACMPSHLASRLVSPKLWQSALRFAQENDGAPAQCSRRSCRSQGSCALRWKKNEPLQCGAGISQAALEQAARYALFGAVMRPDQLTPPGQSPARRPDAKKAQADGSVSAGSPRR